MSQVTSDVLVCGLVTAMAVYKSIELYTAKLKIDQTAIRAANTFPDFETKLPGDTFDLELGSVATEESEFQPPVARHLGWLKRLHVDYGIYTMMLIIIVFALLGFGLMLFKDVSENWGQSIVIAACTMLVSLFGALVNLAVELIRLRLDNAGARKQGAG